MVIDHPTALPSREHHQTLPLVLTAVMDHKLLDDDVPDLLMGSHCQTPRGS